MEIRIYKSMQHCNGNKPLYVARVDSPESFKFSESLEVFRSIYGSSVIIVFFVRMIGENNPLNVRFNHLNKWLGQTGSTKGFCDFDTLEHGIRAAADLLIRSYTKKGAKSYANKIELFAPPSENDTNRYINFVCGCCNVFPWDYPVTLDDYRDMICAMSRMEGNRLDILIVTAVLQKYFTKYLKNESYG